MASHVFPGEAQATVVSTVPLSKSSPGAWPALFGSSHESEGGDQPPDFSGVIESRNRISHVGRKANYIFMDAHVQAIPNDKSILASSENRKYWYWW